MPESKRPLKVFLCHAHSDQNAVRELYQRLTNDGVDAWLDKENLLPGQDWEMEIQKAVRESDVVLVCLSKQFNRAGFRQKEVRLALDTAMEQPEGEIFIIPARLEECDNLESLKRWHWVDLFEDKSYEKLMKSLNLRMSKLQRNPIQNNIEETSGQTNIKPETDEDAQNTFEKYLSLKPRTNASNNKLNFTVSEFQHDTKQKQVQRTRPQIIIRESALECARRHALYEQDMETGGFLLGSFHPKSNSTVVAVTGIVRALFTIRKVTNLVFTPNTWQQALNRIEDDPIYSDYTVWSIVGWYHTHPSFGIFLSTNDLSIHKTHFQRPENIALVIDPMRQEEGIFCLDLSMIDMVRHKYEIKNDKEMQKFFGDINLPVSEII